MSSYPDDDQVVFSTDTPMSSVSNMSYGRLENEAEDSLDSDREDGDRSLDGHVTSVGIKPRRAVIIEPVLALYFVAWLPGITLQGQFLYDQFARRNNLSSYATGNTSSSSCGVADHNSSFFRVQQKSQEEATQFSIYIDAFSSSIQLVAVLIYGSLSDKLGRRIPMILPLIGGAIRYASFALVIALNLPMHLLLLGAGIDALLGGQSTILMAAFSYIADITTKKTRTLKITIAEIACGGASAVAQVTIGFLAKYTGYLYPYYFLLGVHLGNCLYVIFFVPETRPSPESLGFSSLLAVHKHIAAAVRVYTTDDNSGRRTSMLLCLPALFLFGLVLTGRLGPQTLYLLNSPFCWSSVQIGIYMAIFALCTNGGQILSYAFLYKRIGDTGIALKGALSCAISLVLLGLASTSWMVYIVPVIGYGATIPIPMLRSVMSKITSPDEQGALFAGVSGMETLTTLLASLVFNPIYEKTLYFMPGFVFLVMAGLEAIGIVFLIGFIAQKRRQLKLENARPNSIYNARSD